MNQQPAPVLSAPKTPLRGSASSIDLPFVVSNNNAIETSSVIASKPGEDHLATTEWGSSDSALSPRKDIPRTILFILNRNGLDVDQLRSKFTDILRIKYASDDVKVLWISIFGKMPEQPHAFITLSDETIAKEILDDGTIEIELDNQTYNFEISEAVGMEAKEDEDALCIFVAGVPAEQGEEKLRAKLIDYFAAISPVAEVIFTRDWVNNKSVILKLPSEACAQMIARCTRFCTFEGHLLSCRYARRQVVRPPRPVKKADKKGFIKVTKKR